MFKIKILLFLFVSIIFNCSRTNLEKINLWLEKEEYEKLLEFSWKNKPKLNEEELYLSSQAVSRLQNFLRKNKLDEKYSKSIFYQNLESKTGLKIKLINTDNGILPTIEDIYEKSLVSSKYYNNKCILDKFKFTSGTNEISENSFLLVDILEIDPRLFLQEFKLIWLESMKLGLPGSLNEESKDKFIKVLHFLASKDETDLKNHFFITEGTNVNLRSGPGTENANIGKLNKEEVFQIDADYNTTTISNKTGKWIQIYIWSNDTVGWIFSPFLKKTKFNTTKAKLFEAEISKLSNSLIIDFNNWNPEEIPDGFYGNYSITKKEILDANIGFAVFPSQIEQGICRKLKDDTQRISISFADQDSSERILIFYLKGFVNTKSITLVKFEIEKNRLFLNSKELDFEIEKNKPNTVDLKLSKELDSKLKFSIISASNREFFQSTNIKRNEIESWEVCIPQGKKSSSHILLFSFTIY
jgi:hypothetical protein